MDFENEDFDDFSSGDDREFDDELEQLTREAEEQDRRNRQQYRDDYVGGDKSSEKWRPIIEINLRTPEALELRRQMVDYMAKKRPEITPHAWQLDVAVSVALGHDVLGIAGTGSGKSMCYQLLAGLENSTHIIISPLAGLVEAQAASLNNMGISAIGLTGDSISKYGPDIWKDISDCKFQFVISAPEILLHPESEFWKSMVRNREQHPFLLRLRTVTVDEAHMVWKWGYIIDRITLTSFRADFAQIGNLRVLFPTIPFLLLSATITPVVRAYLYTVMKLHSPAYIARCSIRRNNIRVLFAATVEAKKNNTFCELDFLFTNVETEYDISELPKGMIYSDERNKCQDIVKYMRSCIIRKLPPPTTPSVARLKEVIVPYTGLYDANTNTANMENLTTGKTRYMVCTEAAGMGLDIRDIGIVVQYRIGKNTTAADIWQRLGRCARDPTIKGLGIVFVDNVDRLILDPAHAIVNGFDYGLALTQHTVQKVRDQIATMYALDNRKKGGSEIDPGLLWTLNTPGCRPRLLYALFSEPSAYDFSENSEYQCDCDNCSFPDKTHTNRLIPPEELREYVSRAKIAEVVAAQARSEIPIAQLRDERKTAAMEQEVIGKTGDLGFTLDKTLRYRDTAAYEKDLIEEELAKMQEAQGRNAPALQAAIRSSVKSTWEAIAIRERLTAKTGLLPTFLFPDALIKKIATHTNSLVFAEEGGEKKLDAIIGPKARVKGTFFAPYISEIQAAIKDGVATHMRQLEEHDRENRAAGISANNSRAASIASRRGVSQASDAGDTERNNDWYCPSCYAKGRYGKYLSTQKYFDNHLGTKGHLQAVEKIIKKGSTHPRYSITLEFVEKHHPNTSSQQQPSSQQPSHPQHPPSQQQHSQNFQVSQQSSSNQQAIQPPIPPFRTQQQQQDLLEQSLRKATETVLIRNLNASSRKRKKEEERVAKEAKETEERERQAADREVEDSGRRRRRR